MLLRDVPYQFDFKLNGKRYRQFIRPKNPPDPNDFTVLCFQPPQSEAFNIHCSEEVKPIIKV